MENTLEEIIKYINACYPVTSDKIEQKYGSCENLWELLNANLVYASIKVSGEFEIGLWFPKDTEIYV